MPSVSQRVASTRSQIGVPVQEEQAAEKALGSSSQGPAQDSQKELYRLHEMQHLGQSWQVLADAICHVGVRATEAGMTQVPSDAGSDHHLSLSNPDDISAVEDWDALQSLLESRAWWWGKAVFDSHVQACFFDAGQAGRNSACAMTIVADFMLREHSKLKSSASLLETISKPSQDPLDGAASTWAETKLRIADEVLSKLN